MRPRTRMPALRTFTPRHSMSGRIVGVLAIRRAKLLPVLALMWIQMSCSSPGSNNSSASVVAATALGRGRCAFPEITGSEAHTSAPAIQHHAQRVRVEHGSAARAETARGTCGSTCGRASEGRCRPPRAVRGLHSPGLSKLIEYQFTPTVHTASRFSRIRRARGPGAGGSLPGLLPNVMASTRPAISTAPRPPCNSGLAGSMFPFFSSPVMSHVPAATNHVERHQAGSRYQSPAAVLR